MMHASLHTDILMSVQGIRTVSASVFQLAGISSSTAVQLQDNSIEHLPGDIFQPFAGSVLSQVRLDGNQLRFLPEGLLAPIKDSLRVLLLSRNQLEYLDVHLFTPLADLRELYIRSNPNLGCIPELPVKFPPTMVDKDADMIDCPTCTAGGQTLFFGEEVCRPCKAGTYSPASAAAKYGDCQACPANSTSLSGSASVFDCKCQKGYTGPDGGPCAACGPGSYKDVNGSISCTNCPTFTSSPIGSSNVSQCICRPGYSGQAGRACSPCPLGTFKHAYGSSSCIPCSAGTYSTTASANDESACLLCPGNSSTPATGSQHITNCTCNRGFAGRDGGDCAPCQPGTYKAVTGNLPCLPCPAGTFSQSSGATSNSSCSSCPRASFSGIGAGTKTQCECNAGYSGPSGGPCSACAPGLFKNSSGSARCSPCPAGTFADSLTRCRDCPGPLTSVEASPDVSYCLCGAGFRGPGFLGEGLELLPPLGDAALLEDAGFFAPIIGEAQELPPASSNDSTALLFLDSAGYYGHLASLVDATTWTMECSDDAAMCTDGDRCKAAQAPSCEVTFSGLDPSKALWVTIDLAHTDFAGSDEYISSARASISGEDLCEGHGYSKAECTSLGSQFGQPCCYWNASASPSDYGWLPAGEPDGVGACFSQAPNMKCDAHFLGSGFLASGGEDQNCAKVSRVVDAVHLPRGAVAGEITITLNASSAVGSVARSQWCLNSTIYARVSVSQPNIKDSITVLVYPPATQAQAHVPTRLPVGQPAHAQILKLMRNFSGSTCTSSAEPPSSGSEPVPSCSATPLPAAALPAGSTASQRDEVRRLLEACARDRSSTSNQTSTFCPDPPIDLLLCSACLPGHPR